VNPPGVVSSTDDARSAHRPAIQGLRAVAVLMVVAYHAGLPVPGGFTGVDVFFVISGFVIAEMLRREWGRTGTIELREFFRRRVRRLLPALALVIVVTLVLNALIVAPLAQPARTALTGLGGLLLSANAVIALTSFGYFDAPAATNPLLHLWSLSVEEQFYLVLPPLLLIAWRRARRRARGSAVPVVLALAVVSGAIMVAGPSIAEVTALPSASVGFYSPIVRTWEFLVGVLLALTHRWRDLRAPSRRLAGAAGLALLLLSAFIIDGSVVFPGPLTVLPVAGAALLIIATEARTGRLHTVLASRVMIAIGDRSYAWYLWHWPLIVFAVTMASGAAWASWAPSIAALVSLAPTWWSYRSIEQPLRRHEHAPLRPLLVRALIVPVGLAAAMSWGAANAWFNPALADAAAQTRSVSQRAGCHGLLDELGPERFEDCWFGPDADAPPIVLLGDSNAASAADAVVPAGEVLGRPVLASTGPSCPPFLDVKDLRSEACAQLNAQTFAWLTLQPPGHVVLVATDTYWFRDGAIDPDVAGYEEALRSTVLSVQAAGHQAVIVTSIPLFVGLEDGTSSQRWNFTNCTTLRFIRGTCGRSFTLAPDWPQRPLWDAAAAVAASTGAAFVDLLPSICPEGECRTDRDGVWDYRDGIHLSARKSSELSGMFVDALAR